jgi:hypothetical protein
MRLLTANRPDFLVFVKSAFFHSEPLGGQITRLRMFQERAEALEAARLRE